MLGRAEDCAPVPRELPWLGELAAGQKKNTQIFLLLLLEIVFSLFKIKIPALESSQKQVRMFWNTLVKGPELHF